ncbi:NAD(P)-dependent oxidoreductase [Nocardia sp. NBC_00565]|uniref:NAD(P)-dependent oxidoreductase n=1 Tax=Nocardia sp. NBC_00565 TaxID=2975993 RepID=UPI002E80E6A8|nr:NAD(P)-dependent oxidoreductase [Nocardia sp. NBC_00565]WUC06290.1 NAD(P)-dependent oxidoreductase [Nocardia sp. NBC_00565]
MTDAKTGQVAFLGLGNMGARMSKRLLDAGYAVLGFDPDADARRSLTAAGGTAAPDAATAVAGASFVILMLPNSAVVEATLGDAAVLDALRPGSIVVDMSSSEPLSTQRLSYALAKRRITLIDAPVSGGISGAESGTLTIMAGGTETAVARIAALLEPLGKLHRVGNTGAGHALKAINNLLAAVHLLAGAEGFAAGRRFGLDPELMVSMINISSGRSASTELKFPRFILPQTYDSGFGLALMLKDMRIATGLADALGVGSPLGQRAVELWAEADAALGPGADQTEIARWVLRQPNAKPADTAGSDHHQ